MNTFAGDIPSEIAGQLDSASRCNAPTIHGGCAYPVIRGEFRCIEHSNSVLGRRLRDRQIAILRHTLRDEWRKKSEFAFPGPDGRYLSQTHAEDRARFPGHTAMADLEAAGQLRLPLGPVASDFKRADRWDTTEEARLLGELATTCFATESVREQQIAREEIVKQQAAAIVKETFELRREQRRDARLAARSARRLTDSSAPRVYFRGDPSTPFGLIASANAYSRLYLEGKISQRECEMHMRALRVMAVGRLLGCTRPLRFPEPPQFPDVEIVELDTRPYLERSTELEQMRDRIRNRRRVEAQDVNEERTEIGNAIAPLQAPDNATESEV